MEIHKEFRTVGGAEKTAKRIRRYFESRGSYLGTDGRDGIDLYEITDPKSGEQTTVGLITYHRDLYYGDLVKSNDPALCESHVKVYVPVSASRKLKRHLKGRVGWFRSEDSDWNILEKEITKWNTPEYRESLRDFQTTNQDTPASTQS